MAISGSDGSIILTTKIDQSGLNKGMASLKNAVTKIGAAIGVAFGVRVLVQFGKQAVQLASDLQEVQNVVDVAFGNMAYRMEQFADTAIETFGISELTAKQTGSSFMAMAKGMQIADDVAADMALTMTGLSADMASFYNIRQEEAKTALSAVYTGETETLKRYGILITEVNLQEYARQQGITKSINAMTQQEKVMLRYQYILQATQLAQGDFVRTQDSWANQTRILSERWKEMQRIFGEAFMTIGTLVLPIINKTIEGLTRVAEAARIVAQWIYKAFTGKEIKTIQSQGASFSSVGAEAIEAANGIEELGNATEKAGKQAKNSTASFDELHVISSDIGADTSKASGFDTGGFSGGVGNDVQFQETGNSATWLSEKLETLKSAFSGLQELNFSRLSTSFSSLTTPLKELGNLAWNNLNWAIRNVIVPLTTLTINELLPNFIEKLSQRLSSLNNILKKAQPLYKDFVDNFLKPIVEFAKPKILEFWENFNKRLLDIEKRLSASELWQDFQTVLNGLYKVLVPIVKAVLYLLNSITTAVTSHIFNDLKTIIQDIGDTIGLVAAVINGDFSEAWKHFKELLIDNRIEDAKDDIEVFKNSIADIVKPIGEMATAFKDAVGKMLKNWRENISNWWTNDVEPWFTKEKWEELFFNIGESIANAIVGVNGFVEKWRTSITNWWNDDVSPWFTINKWKELFRNIGTSISKFFTAENGFIQTWKTNIANWWTNEVEPWFTIRKWKELGENIKDGLVDGFNGAVNGIRRIINKILDGFQGLVNGAIDMLNSLIAGYNKVADATPGLKSIGKISKVDLSKYKLPMLAKGAVIPGGREFLAVLGDQPKGQTNIETPLDTMIQAFRTALADGGYSGETSVNFTIELDGDTLYKGVKKAENRRAGISISNPAFAR